MRRTKLLLTAFLVFSALGLPACASNKEATPPIGSRNPTVLMLGEILRRICDGPDRPSSASAKRFVMTGGGLMIGLDTVRVPDDSELLMPDGKTFPLDSGRGSVTLYDGKTPVEVKITVQPLAPNVKSGDGSQNVELDGSRNCR